MEHIISIGVNVDDDAIQKAVINTCVKEIKEDFRNEIKEILTESTTMDDVKYRKRIESIIREVSDDYLERYREDILKIATDKLVYRMERTKSVRDVKINAMLDNMADETEN